MIGINHGLIGRDENLAYSCYIRGNKWHWGLVVDTWLRDQKVPGLNPGYARSTLSLWKKLFTCISSPHSCVKQVHDYRQYARVTAPL